jgi:uncharacterized membrane protein YraQ (UPF0718 family)/copper chaperone CopZ
VATFLSAAWAVLAAMAPYLLLGFAAAGVLSVLVSAEWVERHLGGRGLWQVLKASLFGVPLPLCSCGVIPVAASLRRHGASKGATTSFLLSTPQTGVDSIAVTYALLGPFLAIFRPLAALVTGLVGGTLVHSLDTEEDGADRQPAATAASCSDGCCGDEEQDGPALRRIWHYGFVTLPRDIGKALFVGIAVSGLIGALVAPDSLAPALGGGLLPMLAAMAVGIPLYVCATASTPIALGFIVAGLSPGAALVFLVSGPATNAATVTTLWKVLGRRTAILYLLTVAVCALGSGLAVDALVSSGVVPFAVGAAGGGAHAHHLLEAEKVGLLGHLGALALLAVLLNALRPRSRPTAEALPEPTHETESVTLDIAGMHCHGCVSSVTRALQECPGVATAAVDLDSGKAVVAGRSLDSDALRHAVTGLGFEVREGPPHTSR